MSKRILFSGDNKPAFNFMIRSIAVASEDLAAVVNIRHVAVAANG